jgi:hypothetical protein
MSNGSNLAQSRQNMRQTLRIKLQSSNLFAQDSAMASLQTECREFDICANPENRSATILKAKP